MAEEFGAALPATTELLIPSLLIAALGGVALGIIAAYKRYTWVDNLSSIVAVFGMSMPVFWFGLVLQLVFFLWLGWLPVGRRLDAASLAPPRLTGLFTIDSLFAANIPLFWEAVRHLVLPVIALSVVYLAEMARMTRSALLEVLGQDYIRVARGKGLRERVIVLRHALRNALIPIVTVLGLMVGRTLGGAIIVETIFTWPGIGRQVISSLFNLDLPMVAAYGLLLSLGVGLSNLLADVCYLLIDPRIRFEGRR